MKLVFVILVVLCGVAPMQRAYAQASDVEAMLILASNEPAPLDRRLERVDYVLRPLLRFETYRLLGQGSVLFSGSGSASIALGDGHVVNLAGGGKGRVEVTWMRGNDRLISTSVTLKKGKPTILGGVPQGEGRLIVTLMVK